MIWHRFTFNGVSLFATTVSDAGGSNAKIGDRKGTDNTLSVFASANGSSGPIVSINKGFLISALTIDDSQLVNTTREFR